MHKITVTIAVVGGKCIRLLFVYLYHKKLLGSYKHHLVSTAVHPVAKWCL